MRLQFTREHGGNWSWFIKWLMEPCGRHESRDAFRCVLLVKHSSHIDLGLCDASAGRSLFHRRRSEVVCRTRPQHDFLLTHGQHLIQFLCRRRHDHTDTINKHPSPDEASWCHSKTTTTATWRIMTSVSRTAETRRRRKTSLFNYYKRFESELKWVTVSQKKQTD